MKSSVSSSVAGYFPAIIAGKKVTADRDGFWRITRFDVKSEQADWRRIRQS